MNPFVFIGVALAGGIGAAARFALDRAVLVRTRGAYPWGITVVNLTGSFAIGVVAGLADSSVLQAPWVALLAVGLLGGYTTFSAVMVETVLMIQRREFGSALLNGGVQLIAAIALAGGGMALGRAF